MGQGLSQPMVIPSHLDYTKREVQKMTKSMVHVGITVEKVRGLYNPITLSGSIIVDGVAVSVHSDWFLDASASAAGMTHMLPAAYQVRLYISCP